MFSDLGMNKIEHNSARIRLSWEADIGSDLDLSKGLATHAFERLQGAQMGADVSILPISCHRQVDNWVPGPSTKVLQPVYFKFLEHYGLLATAFSLLCLDHGVVKSLLKSPAWQLCQVVSCCPQSVLRRRANV